MSDFIANSQLLRWDNVLEGTGIVFDRLGGLGKNVSISVDTNVIATVASLEAYQQVSSKDAAGGYAGLDASGKLATAQINFDTSTFYIDANGILKLKTDRISNPFTATGLGADGVPTGLTLGEDAATLADVEVNDTIRFSTAISWNGTDYDAQTVFMRVATTAGTLADFAVQGAPVTSMDQLEQGAVNKYLTAALLEKVIRMNYSDIAYTGQLDSTADDCNSYLTTGVWNVPNASAIANTPNKGQGGILFCFQRGTYSTSARVQVYLQSAGAANPVIPYVRVYNGTAATWSAWERIIKSTDLATTAANGLMSASDKVKLDNTLPQSDSDARYIRNGFSGERKMCLSNNQDVPEEGGLNYIAACGYGSNNTAICHGLTVARRPNGSYAIYLQTFGQNSTLEVCSKGAATVIGYSAKTLQTSIYGDKVDVSCNTFTINNERVATINDLSSSTYLATSSANGLMSAADKAKMDGLGTQTQLDGKYVKKTGDTMTGNLVFPTGKGVNGSLMGVYPSTVSASTLDELLKANTTCSYTFYYFEKSFPLTPALIAKNVVLEDNANTMQTWNSGHGERYQRAIIYPSSSNPLLKFCGDTWKEYIFREDLASPTQAGVMSAADKTKLDTLKTQAQLDDKYVVNTAGNSSGKINISCIPGTVDTNGTTVFRVGTDKSRVYVTKDTNGTELLALANANGTARIDATSAIYLVSRQGDSSNQSSVSLYGSIFTFTPPGGTASQIQTAADIAVTLRGNTFLATVAENGLMSSVDKAKLDKLTPDVFAADFDFALAPTQGQLAIVLKNAPAVPPWNFHTEIEVQQFSGAPADRSEPARYVAEGHFAVGEYDLLVTGFPTTAANGTYKDSGGRVWTHSTASQYTIKYSGGRWRIYDGTTILYSTHSDDGNPYGSVGSTDGSWVWCTGDTMTYLTGPKVVADTATSGAASWRSVNYNATSISNFLYAGKYTTGGVTYPAIFLAGKFTQGKVIVRHLDYNATAVAADLELVASTSAVGTIQADAAKRWDPVPGNVEWDALTAQLIQATNRGDGVRRSYCTALTLGGSAYSGVFGWSATACTVAVPVVSLDLQNTPTDFAIDVTVENAAAEKTFALALTNGIQGTHCMVSFRNVSTYRIGMTDGNGKTVYLAGGETALARLVSVNAENRFEWITAGTAGGSTGGTEYVSFTAADVDANGNLVIIAAGEPVAICKTDLSNRVDLGITAQESAAAGLLKSTINVAGIVLGSGTWYAICK